MMPMHTFFGTPSASATDASYRQVCKKTEMVPSFQLLCILRAIVHQVQHCEYHTFMSYNSNLHHSLMHLELMIL